jgi:hypothetical protein
VQPDLDARAIDDRDLTILEMRSAGWGWGHISRAVRVVAGRLLPRSEWLTPAECEAIAAAIEAEDMG